MQVSPNPIFSLGSNLVGSGVNKCLALRGAIYHRLIRMSDDIPKNESIFLYPLFPVQLQSPG